MNCVSLLFGFHCHSSFFFFFGFSRSNVIMKWVVCESWKIYWRTELPLHWHQHRDQEEDDTHPNARFVLPNEAQSVGCVSLLFGFHCSSFFFFFGSSRTNVIMKWVVWVCCLDFIVLLLSFSFLVTHVLMWSWNELWVTFWRLIKNRVTFALTSAPRSRRRRHTSKCPFSAAKWSAVCWFCESVVWISLSFFFLFLFWLLTS